MKPGPEICSCRALEVPELVCWPAGGWRWGPGHPGVALGLEGLNAAGLLVGEAVSSPG